jgi:hypothetical protein
MVVADRFSELFRQEHRQVRDLLLEFIEAFPQRDGGRTGKLLEQVAQLTGPHFRYEEEALYPALTQIFGAGYIEQLFRAHDGIIRTAFRLSQLAGRADLDDDEVDEAVKLTRSILPHVSDCDGLSIMVERLPEQAVQRVLDVRERSRDAGLDLLTWASEIRGRATPSSRR